VTEREDGEELLVPPRRTRRSKYGYAGGAAVLAAALLVAVLTRNDNSKPNARPAPPSSHALPTPVQPVPTRVGTGPTAPVLLGSELAPLGAVQLFARAANAVLHLDFAAGGVTLTPIPALQSTGPVTFLATATGSVVRPLDAVPGYFVADGGPARPLRGLLARADVLPGPDAESVWVEEDAADRISGLRLVHLSTSAVTDRTLPIPARIGDIWIRPESDGSGYVLVGGQHGIFDLRPDGAHRLPALVGTEALQAAGANRLLVAACPERSPGGACTMSVVRLPDGAVRRVPGSAVFARSLLVGPIAPDGRTALVCVSPAPGQTALELLDLASGEPRGAPVPVDPDVMPGAAVFSPDGRWAFVVAGGALVVLDVQSGGQQALDVTLPYVYQLAVRD